MRFNILHPLEYSREYGKYIISKLPCIQKRAVTLLMILSKRVLLRYDVYMETLDMAWTSCISFKQSSIKS